MKRNKNFYFIRGLEAFIAGELHATRRANDVYGSWQVVSTAKGYNALVPLFATHQEHYAYHDAIIKSVIRTEKQYMRYTLHLTNDCGQEFVIKVPYLLCQPSAFMAIVSEYGFTEIRRQ